MKRFLKVADAVDVLPLAAALHRNSDLWDQHRARTDGAGPHQDVSDIWVRFRDPADLTAPEAFLEPFVPVMYPAWHALPPLRPIIFGLMARLEAVELGGILVTRVPAGKQVAPHDDRGRWHPEHYATKVYLPLQTNPHCVNTCGDEAVVMREGEAWLFDNLQIHSTVNDGATDRVTLIVSLKCA